jgi:hypothetical protein
MGGALGLPAGAAAALVAWTFGGGATTGLVLAALAAAWLGALTTPPGAVVAAAQCWACFDGFVVHRFGSLGGGRADLLALAVVAGAGLAVAAAATVVRRHRVGSATRGYPAVRIPAVLPRVGSMPE